MNKRLLNLKRKLGVNWKVLAMLINGRSIETLRNWRNGKTQPRLDDIQRIEELERLPGPWQDWATKAQYTDV